MSKTGSSKDSEKDNPFDSLLAGLEARQAKRKRQQERQAWHADPTALAERLSGGRWLTAPHLLLLSKALQRYRRLIVSMPPRHGKSEFVSFWYPVWYLDRNPDKRVMLASYEADFAANWGRKVRTTIQENGDALNVRVRGDVQAAGRWETTMGGGMVTAGVGGPITGRGADLLIIDDPVKNAEEAASKTFRDRAWDWWVSTAFTRLEPGASAIIVMTRWHQDDLVGRLLASSEAQDWTSIVLPAVADADDLLGRPVGAPLWPERYDSDDLDSIRRTVGSRVWTALYQQRPAPDEGSIFKTAWWRFYCDAAGKCTCGNPRPPETIDGRLTSWDFAFKKSDDSDYVVGARWDWAGADCYVVDLVRNRMTFTETVAAVQRFCEKHSDVSEHLVEEKANGAAIIDTLRRAIQGIIPIIPTDSKEARANAVTPIVEAGNVYLPAHARWTQEFILEHASFPNGKHDDMVDTTSQALLRIRDKASRPQPYGFAVTTTYEDLMREDFYGSLFKF